MNHAVGRWLKVGVLTFVTAALVACAGAAGEAGSRRRAGRAGPAGRACPVATACGRHYWGYDAAGEWYFDGKSVDVFQ